jgi:hypothetical protein
VAAARAGPAGPGWDPQGGAREMTGTERESRQSWGWGRVERKDVCVCVCDEEREKGEAEALWESRISCSGHGNGEETIIRSGKMGEAQRGRCEEAQGEVGGGAGGGRL